MQLSTHPSQQRVALSLHSVLHRVLERQAVSQDRPAKARRRYLPAFTGKEMDFSDPGAHQEGNPILGDCRRRQVRLYSEVVGQRPVPGGGRSLLRKNPVCSGGRIASLSSTIARSDRSSRSYGCSSISTARVSRPGRGMRCDISDAPGRSRRNEGKGQANASLRCDRRRPRTTPMGGLPPPPVSAYCRISSVL